ncbi:MAG: SDR family oxidoreductase [Anaerolineae bacterium]|nr:SDR family oxidoreductase [Anaerolineae bacterium]NUQ02521.1 SDR family oxidoreductase [Anaerolineae bacterium]
MRVLITGGAGFIGSHLTDRFLRENHCVIGVDNLITGNTRNIAHLVGHEKYTFVRQDVTHYLYFDKQIDAVLHFASPASPVDYLKYPIQTLKVGALGTHNALGLAMAKGARFLLASTSEVYGDPLQHPQREDYAGNVDPIGPRGVYDEAKRYAEALTMAYHRQHGLDTRIVRIFNTYGPRMRLDDGRVVPNLIGQALRGEPLTVYGDGRQTRSFQYISDLVEGVYRLLMSDFSEPVNIGTTEEMSILDFAQHVSVLTGSGAGIVLKADDRVVGDPQTRRPDISRAKAVLNWSPQVTLSEGLPPTVEYFRQILTSS